jgi:hypothetical protein
VDNYAMVERWFREITDTRFAEHDPTNRPATK